MICSAEGVPIRSNLDDDDTHTYDRRAERRRRPFGLILAASDCGRRPRSNAGEASPDARASPRYTALLSQLALKAGNVVRCLDETDDLTFFRIRSRKHEIMIAPDPEYLLIVIQSNQK